MSILSDAWSRKITWATAAAEIGRYVAKAFSGNAVATQAEAAVLSDLKQAASNAIGYADTAIGALIAPAASSIEATVNAAISSAVGPAATLVTPAVDHAIATIVAALKAEIDMAAVKARAALAPPGTAEES